MELLVIAAVLAVIAVLDLGAIRYGADSRDRSVGNDWGASWNG